MKLKYVDGCTCNSLTVDGIETIELPLQKVKDTIKTLIDKETDLGLLQSILIDFIENKGSYKYLYTCSDCGDSVYETTLEI